ncbi:MAG: hypothetical protein DYG94_08090 [Leptolyngbya sp. PLA3]|nr:MAG: hypothetical protein EDM82_09465 [Cyanobacteria bacterium CYA]MCE7968692.1 hypothetical protein [Leptolyngbya sp. PL-A3]
MKTALVSGLALTLAAGVASADPINYLDTLSDGEVGAGWAVLPTDGNGSDNPETWEWWNFYAVAGDLITIAVNRTSAAPDMVSSAHFAGASLPTDSSPMMTIFDSPAGTTFAGSGDDNVDDGFGGPFGDPLYSFSASGTGWYAVAVGNFLGSGSGGYTIVITGQTPTPGSAVALLGVGGMAMLRRRR